MATGLTRRAFLATAGVAPLGRALRSRQAAAPLLVADVVVVGGDPAAYAAVFRLAQTPRLRVALVDDAVPWLRASAAPPVSAVADLPPFVRGHQACFDGWRDAGNPGWSYADVLPVFKQLERYEAGASDIRGGSGPLSVMHCWDPHPGHRAFLMAAGPAGYRQDSRHDFNGPRSQGVAGYYQKAIRDDRPHTFAEAFLEPVQTRPAVSVVAGGFVTRVLFDGTRAVGVEYAHGGARRVVSAERAVLLCAAPARATQLLMLSGVGPADAVRALGVPLVADRPGVGRNLHDQLRVALRYGSRQALPDSTVTAGMFTVSLSASPPDLQLDFVAARPGRAPELGLDVTLVRPASRGTVSVRSPDPAAPPAIAIGALTADADVTALVQGMRLARLIATGAPLDPFRGDESAATARVESTAALHRLVRAVVTPCGHLAGACAMGPASDPAAVVDATLAVHGVPGLRVAGAAVMPTVVNAPPDAAALMIGDRAATFALQG